MSVFTENLKKRKSYEKATKEMLDDKLTVTYLRMNVFFGVALLFATTWYWAALRMPYTKFKSESKPIFPRLIASMLDVSLK